MDDKKTKKQEEEQIEKESEESSEKDELVWKEDEQSSRASRTKEEEESVKAEENDEGEKEEEEEIEEEATEDGEESEEVGEEHPAAHEDIKKSDILRRDLNQFVRDNQPSYNLTPQSRSSKKLITLILFILAIVIIGGGIYFMAGLGGSKKETSPTPAPSATPIPTPTPKALNRAEWSFEVLNGSGVTGAAKKIADQLKDLGYPVVKTGNADRDDYIQNQFFVKKELEDSVELVINDIKDIIKIASVSGELTDSTASARIIIGK